MLGIIIINYNQAKMTIKCIESIQNTFYGEKIIYVIDNKSSDSSAGELEKYYKNYRDIKVIQAQENLGYARANNLGINCAKVDGCKYVLISNNDVFYKSDAIKILYETIITREFFLVAPLVRNKKGDIQRTTKNRKGFLGYIFGETILSRIRFLKKQKKIYFLKKVYWVNGCSFIVSLKEFEKIGFFDDYTFLYFEEFILSEKARMKNLKIGYQPLAEVVHLCGATVGENNILMAIENWRSESYFLSKYRKWNSFQIGILKIFYKARKIKMSEN